MSELSLKQREQIAFYALDVSGNNVPVPVSFLPTIQKVVRLSDKELNSLIKAYNSIEECPCKSDECKEQYEKDKLHFETLKTVVSIKDNLPTLPHASGIHLFRGPTGTFSTDNNVPRRITGTFSTDNNVNYIV